MTPEDDGIIGPASGQRPQGGEDRLRQRRRWDLFFMDIAKRASGMSKDPTTKVGALVVQNRRILATGFNGLPEGVDDSDERLNDRPRKRQMMVHAEANAVASAARNGTAIRCAWLYLWTWDCVRSAPWGGPPCPQCMGLLINSGIRRVIYHPMGEITPAWHKDFPGLSIEMAEESGVASLEWVL